MVRVIKKRPFISFGFVALLIAGSLFVAFGRQTDAAKVGGLLVLNVDLDGFSTFDLRDPDGTGSGPFFISGDIVEGDTKVGDYFCWGWVIELGVRGVISQEFNLDGHGKIQVQGVETPDGGVFAVVGGTGRFRNARGEGVRSPTDEGFRIAFKLQGAGRLHDGRDNDDDDDD